MDGKIIHHDKYGYGLTWRRDRYNRVSARFQNGREINGFSEQELRIVDNKEFEENDVMSKLQQVGLADYISKDSSSIVAPAIVAATESKIEIYEELKKILPTTPEAIEDFREKGKKMVMESSLSPTDKFKIQQRIQRIKEPEKAVRYVKNSLSHLMEEDEKNGMIKLNIRLNDIINILEG